ncbi:MAG TPA: Flp family type IVb pilin [Paraburkholderia sp.]|uniref:Flp family type IVb pilin n=1 Tax=unclassified Paraburkholderia TaxID=2615204 RepID=UPI002E16D492|nr:Flp family type IVb pilin [Paraburkholderia sp. MPAMCS5]
MKSFINSAKAFVRDEEGVTAIEYGLIATLIALAIIVGVTAVGTNLGAKFTLISTKLA